MDPLFLFIAGVLGSLFGLKAYVGLLMGSLIWDGTAWLWKRYREKEN